MPTCSQASVKESSRYPEPHLSIKGVGRTLPSSPEVVADRHHAGDGSDQNEVAILCLPRGVSGATGTSPSRRFWKDDMACGSLSRAHHERGRVATVRSRSVVQDMPACSQASVKESSQYPEPPNNPRPTSLFDRTKYVVQNGDGQVQVFVPTLS
jgi:hypothetical protein